MKSVGLRLTNLMLKNLVSKASIKGNRIWHNLVSTATPNLQGKWQIEITLKIPIRHPIKRATKIMDTYLVKDKMGHRASHLMIKRWLMILKPQELEIISLQTRVNTAWKSIMMASKMGQQDLKLSNFQEEDTTPNSDTRMKMGWTFATSRTANLLTKMSRWKHRLAITISQVVSSLQDPTTHLPPTI